MNNVDFNARLTKAMMLVSDLIVFSFVLIGSFYLIIAGIVVMLPMSLIAVLA